MIADHQYTTLRINKTMVWETVKKNIHNRKQNLIMGNNSSGGRGVVERSFLHVSRVKPDTKVEGVESFLKVNFPGWSPVVLANDHFPLSNVWTTSLERLTVRKG
nr:unnamed protein product [Callosobruchus analis]